MNINQFCSGDIVKDVRKREKEEKQSKKAKPFCVREKENNRYVVVLN